MIQAEDLQFMHQAMSLAQKGEGAVNPNPLVGALVVIDGVVVAQGYHARYGDLHAERNAFADAERRGVDCTGATMYVTLEPCCHHGHQPPCTEAVIAHRIKRIVVGLLDPNPLVAGKGLNMLREAGVEVDVVDADSPLARELRLQNRVFLRYITTHRPWVVAKYAMTLDGKVCTHTGDSRWISGPESRQLVHRLRKCLTGIVCGSGTVLADNPMLNTRIADEPEARNPIRIVIDRRLRIPLDCQLVLTARQQPTVVAYAEGADAEKLALLQEAGVVLWSCDTIDELLLRAGQEHIDSLLLEGGGTLCEAFFREALVDEVYAFVAPKIVGGAEAKTPVEGVGVDRMADARQLYDVSVEQIAGDVLVHCFVSPQK